jgi:hypothetical protein
MLRVLSQREKLIFWFTVGIITLAVVFKFCLAPVLDKNDLLNREISATRAKLKKYLKLNSQKQDLQERYSRLTANLDLSSQQADPLVAALAALESFAREANIRIVDVRPQAVAKAPGVYQELSIDLRSEGAMPDYLKFIYSLENSLSLLRIKRLQLNSRPNTEFLEGAFSISQISAKE